MGVKHLNSFIQSKVPNGVIDISIKNECLKYFRKYDCRPIIIIDLLALMRLALNNKEDTLCGGRYNIYHQIYENFIKALSSFAEIIFFEDGPVLNQKMPKWFEKHKKNYEISLKIIDKITEGFPLTDISKIFKDIPFSIAHLIIIKHIAQKYGRVFVTITKECDAEIARYAQINDRTMAILSDDTDFLIFRGNWRLFSISRLNYINLTTVELNRVALRNYLNLDDTQLIALSTLSGNDIISTNEVLPLYQTQFGSSLIACEKRFLNLAKFIREKLPKNQNNLLKVLKKNFFKRQDADKLKESFNMYNINFKINEPTDPLLKFCREKHYDFAFSVLNKLPKNFTFLYIDLRNKNYLKIAQVTMKLYRKQIGILTKNDPNLKDASFVVTTKISHKQPYQNYHYTPIIPNFFVPPLIELLQRNKFPVHDKIRFQLLKWTISDLSKFQNFDLERIPLNYLHDVLILTFLVSEGMMSVKEADMILFSINKVENNAEPISISAPNTVHPRAFHLSFLYGKIHLMILRSLEATGLRMLCKTINFDGVLFHNIYIAYQSKPLKKSFFQDFAGYRLYA